MIAVELDRHRRIPRHLGQLKFDSRALNPVPQPLERIGGTYDLDDIPLGANILGAVLERDLEYLLLVRPRAVDNDDALDLEQVRDRIGLPEVAAVAEERSPASFQEVQS